MLVEKYASSWVVDIHSMSSVDAKKEIEKLLGKVPPEISEVIVIHGYRDGQVLLDMVRKKLKHKRIKRKILTLNQGETILVLK